MKKNSCFQLRRLMMLLMAIALLTACMAGCSFGSGDPTDPSEPSETQGQLPSDEATDPSEDPTEPTETEPVEKSVMGTVMYNNLNVRSNASTDSTVLKQLAINSRVEVLSQKVVGDTTWGRIADGWINLYYVEIDGETAEKPTEPSGGNVSTGTGKKGTITATELNIRKSASTESERVGLYVKGDKVEILEQKTVGGTNWGSIGSMTLPNGTKIDGGWLNLHYVKLDTDDSQTATDPTTGTSGGTLGKDYILQKRLCVTGSNMANTNIYSSLFDAASILDTTRGNVPS